MAWIATPMRFQRPRHETFFALPDQSSPEEKPCNQQRCRASLIRDGRILTRPARNAGQPLPGANLRSPRLASDDDGLGQRHVVDRPPYRQHDAVSSRSALAEWNGDVRITDMNWKQVEAYLRRDDRAVLPLGSTEQHSYLRLTAARSASQHSAAGATGPRR